MADALDALSSVHAKDPVVTDSYLLTLSRFGDTTAIVELWNRYYTTAYLAAEDHATKKTPASAIVTASFDRWLARTEKRTYPDTFMADWFADIPADPPTPLHRAVLWAFYAMSEENRTIVWRSAVDQWTPDQIDAVVKTSPGDTAPRETASRDTSPRETSPRDTSPRETSPEETATAPGETATADTTTADTTTADTTHFATLPKDTTPADTAPRDTGPVAQADEQFGHYLTLAATALGLPADLPDFVPGNRRSLLISSMLGSSTEVFDELGARIDSADVIAPPGSPQPLFTPTPREVPLSTVLRIVSIVVVAVALAVIGIVGLTRWNGTAADEPQEVISPTAASRTPVRTPTPTPTPSPTPQETSQESAEPEPEPQANPAPNPQTRTTTTTRTSTTRTTATTQTGTNTGSQPNPPQQPPATSAPAGGGDDNGNGGNGADSGDNDNGGGSDGGDNSTDSGTNGYSELPSDDTNGYSESPGDDTNGYPESPSL